jgi:general secretion pathway protein H
LTRAISEPGKEPAGFTLIELSLVILIIGIIAALLVPRLPDLGATRLEGALRRIGTLSSYLHDEASLRGRVYRLTLDLDENRYWSAFNAVAAEGAATVGFLPNWDPHSSPNRLPDGVSFAVVEAGGVRTTSGTAHIDFRPDGLIGQLLVTLEGEPGRSASLSMNGRSGRVEFLP